MWRTRDLFPFLDGQKHAKTSENASQKKSKKTLKRAKTCEKSVKTREKSVKTRQNTSKRAKTRQNASKKSLQIISKKSYKSFQKKSLVFLFKPNLGGGSWGRTLGRAKGARRASNDGDPTLVFPLDGAGHGLKHSGGLGDVRHTRKHHGTRGRQQSPKFCAQIIRFLP